MGGDGVLCTSTLRKRGDGVNRLWALCVLCTGTLRKRGGGGVRRQPDAPEWRRRARAAG